MSQRVRHVISIALFALLISAPGLAQLTGTKFGAAVFENRKLVPFPEFKKRSVSGWVKDFELYYNDNFGLRGLFLNLNNYFRYFVLRTPASPLVIKGEADWLYYRETPNFDQLLKRKPFTPKELEAWISRFARRSAWAERRGAKYLTVLIPDAYTIYPEFLPEHLRRELAATNNESRSDQLEAAIVKSNAEKCATCPQINFLTLKQELLQAKTSSDLLYFKTDTHWNDLGAYYGYNAVMRALAGILPEKKCLEPLPLTDFDKRTINISGDLAVMLGMRGAITEDSVSLTPKHPRKAILRDLKNYRAQNFHTAVEGPNSGGCAPDLEAVIFRDSFSEALFPYLAEHFKSARFRWTIAFEYELIRKKRPQAVLQILTDRVLYGPQPDG